MTTFELDGIENEVVRDNFRKLNELIQANPVLGGTFKVFEINAPSTGSVRYKHNLEYVPDDILISYKSDDGATVTVNYAETGRLWMSFTVTGKACTFRVLAGRLR